MRAILSGADVTVPLEKEDDLVDNLSHRGLADIKSQVRAGGGLVGVVDARKVSLEQALLSPLIDSLTVALLALLHWGVEVDQVETAELGNLLLGILAALLIGRDGVANDSGTGLGELAGDKGGPLDVGEALLAQEAELRGDLLADDFSVKEGDPPTALLEQGELQGAGDSGLAGAVEPGEEDGEALLLPGRVGFAENLDHLGVREPLRDGGARLEAAAELRAGNIKGLNALLDLIGGNVLIEVRDVGDHLEGDNLNTELVLVLGHHLLGLVGSVGVLAIRHLAWAGVVAADDEVGQAIVLPDEGVPDGLTGPAHPHGEGEEAEGGHSVRVPLHDGVVNADAGEVVNISRLGQAHHRVDEHVGSNLPGSAHSELPVGPVHGIAGLEGHHAHPAELLEEGAELTGSVFKREREKKGGRRRRRRKKKKSEWERA